MSKEIDNYKDFIDGVVSIKGSAVAGWVEDGAYPYVPGNEEKNRILQTLSSEQKAEISKIVQESKESGIHDLLVFLNDYCEISFSSFAPVKWFRGAYSLC